MCLMLRKLSDAERNVKQRCFTLWEVELRY
jgi:hypothetical protein